MTHDENILTPPLMLVRYAGMASLLATVWESRRERQEELARTQAERNSARAQFGLLFDTLAEHGASFSTEQGKVVAGSMPEEQVRR